MPTAVQYWARVRLLQLWDNTTALYFVATDLLDIGGGVVGIIWKSRVASRKFSLVSHVLKERSTIRQLKLTLLSQEDATR